MLYGSNVGHVLALSILLMYVWRLTRFMPLPCTLPPGDIDLSRASTSVPKKPLASNDVLLNHAHKMYHHEILGAESVAVDGEKNTLYLLDRYGYAFSADASSLLKRRNGSLPALEPLGYVGPGRPLGYHVDEGALIICDSLKGLIRFSPETGTVEILANVVNNNTNETKVPVAINYADDLDVSMDRNVVYFSDASVIPPAMNREGFYDTMMSYLLTMMQGEPTGRVLAYNKTERKTEVLASNLWFPNGVAVAADDSFLVVAETCAMRLLKIYLQGEKAGTVEVLLDGLVGYPDGVARASDGNFWVALLAPESPLQKLVIQTGKLGRWVLAWLLKIINVPLQRWGCVLKVRS